jgi:hypothetical protein
MAWKVLETNLSGAETDAPMMLMDANGYPNCVWTDGYSLRFSRFRGNSWERLGDLTAYESLLPISLSKNCMAVDDIGNPHVFFMEGYNLRQLWWNEEAWEVNDVLLNQQDILDWCPVFGDDRYLATLSTDGSSGSDARMYKYVAGVWSLQSGKAMSKQEQNDSQLIARPVSTSIYVFWRNKSGDNGWVSHLIYRVSTESWFSFHDNKVQKSEVVGEITGLDFVPKDMSSVNPNEISSIATTVAMVSVSPSGYLSVNINGSTTNDHFIGLFSGTTSGVPYDTNHVFWGDTANASPKIADGYVSLKINGNKLYLPKYTGSASIGYCSDLVGTSTSSGTFVLAGYALLRVNYADLLYTPVYNKTA